VAVVDINQVANVTITLDTAPIPQAGFDTVMFVGEHKVFNERWRVYNRASDMLGDGFLATDPSYIAIQTLSSGPNKPKIMMVGRREFEDITYTPTVEDLTVYTLELAAPQEAYESFTFTSDATATAAEIVDGLVADFVANASVELTAVVTLANVTDELALTSIASSAYSVKNVSANLNPSTATTAGYETMANTFAAMKGEDAEWAYFGIESRVAADVEAARDHAESTTEIFAHVTDDPNGKLADSTSTLDDGYGDLSLYTIGGWSADAAKYPEMAMLRPLATVQIPGQTTLHGQTQYSVAVDKNSTLTNSESSIVRGKNANTYELVGGFGYTRDGKSYSGEFIDNVDLGRWLKARIQENVYQLVKSKANSGSKVPYTDDGIQMVYDRIAEVANQGIAGGVLDGNYNDGIGYDLTVPKAADVPTNDKANRYLSGVNLVVQTTGAIATIDISGIITV
jgi:hypothetical protein